MIKAAAVADYKPKTVEQSKIKKGELGNLTIELPTVDILKELGKIKDKQILVGFAAETDQVAMKLKEVKRKKI